MTSVCVTFILIDKTGFRLPQTWAPWIGVASFAIALALFVLWRRRLASSQRIDSK